MKLCGTQFHLSMAKWTTCRTRSQLEMNMESWLSGRKHLTANEAGSKALAGSTPALSAMNEVSKESRQCGTLSRESKLFSDIF